MVDGVGKKRLNVDLDRRVELALEAMQADTGRTKSDLVKDSLLCYSVLLAAVGRGEEVYLRSTDGDVTRVILM